MAAYLQIHPVSPIQACFNANSVPCAHNSQLDFNCGLFHALDEKNVYIPVA